MKKLKEDVFNEAGRIKSKYKIPLGGGFADNALFATTLWNR